MGRAFGLNLIPLRSGNNSSYLHPFSMPGLLGQPPSDSICPERGRIRSVRRLRYQVGK